MEVNRLFDILTLMQEKYAQNEVAFAHKVHNEWIKYPISKIAEQVNHLSYALLKIGLQPGDKIGIICGNRPEWNILDYGLQQIGVVSVPIYSTISETDYKHVLSHSEVKYVFVEGVDLYKKIEKILPEIPNIIDIYSIKELPGVKSFNSLLQLGAEHPQPETVERMKSMIQPDEMATLIYTSGTTGMPKGVMLSHRNIVVNVMNIQNIPPTKPGEKALSFLPLCHVYERMIMYAWQMLGLQLYYSDLGNIAANAQEVKPSIMSSIPRVLEKLYDKFYTSGEKLNFIQKTIYYWALRTAFKYKLENRSAWLNIRLSVADKLIYHKWRAALGGKLSTVISGGAALQPRLGHFFTGIGINIIEGYGLTETSPVIAVSTLKKHGRKFGTVGPPIKDAQVKISEEGEILTKGPCVMLGYYKDEEATLKAIDADGWFHTGDLGRIEPEGQLKITGRKKSVFKTSLGKFVNPQAIEEKFKESPFIDQIIVVGEGQKFAAALITLNAPFFKEWWKRKNHGKEYGECPKTLEALIESKPVKDRIKKEVIKYNKCFGSTEQIKKYALIPAEWTADEQQLSQTQKLRRSIIENQYKEEIEKLFI